MLPDAAQVRAAFIGQIELTDVNPLQAESVEDFALTLRDSLELTSATPLAKLRGAPSGWTGRSARIEPSCRGENAVGGQFGAWFEKSSDGPHSERSELSSS
jgi:hypothetical protein